MVGSKTELGQPWRFLIGSQYQPESGTCSRLQDHSTRNNFVYSPVSALYISVPSGAKGIMHNLSDWATTCHGRCQMKISPAQNLLEEELAGHNSKVTFSRRKLLLRASAGIAVSTLQPAAFGWGRAQQFGMAGEQMNARLQCKWREDSGPRFSNDQRCRCMCAD